MTDEAKQHAANLLAWAKCLELSGKPAVAEGLRAAADYIEQQALDLATERAASSTLRHNLEKAEAALERARTALSGTLWTLRFYMREWDGGRYAALSEESVSAALDEQEEG